MQRPRRRPDTLRAYVVTAAILDGADRCGLMCSERLSAIARGEIVHCSSWNTWNTWNNASF